MYRSWGPFSSLAAHKFSHRISGFSDALMDKMSLSVFRKMKDTTSSLKKTSIFIYAMTIYTIEEICSLFKDDLLRPETAAASTLTEKPTRPLHYNHSFPLLTPDQVRSQVKRYKPLVSPDSRYVGGVEDQIEIEVLPFV